MANDDGTNEGSEHAGVGTIGVAGFGDDKGGRRRHRQLQPCLHRIGGRATTVAPDNVGGEVYHGRVIGPGAAWRLRCPAPQVVAMPQIKHLPFTRLALT